MAHTTLAATLKKSLIIIAVAVQTFSYSVIGASRIALADHAPGHTCPTVSGTSSPTGSSAHTFTFDPATCTWENTYYSWSPVTKNYTAKYDQTPVYNPGNDAWEHIVWDYVPAAGAYQSRTVSTPAHTTTSSPATSSSTPTVSSTAQTPGGGTLAQSTGSSTISNTGTGSNNTIDNNNNTDVNADIANNTSVLQTLDSNATSGNANAIGNTTVGNVGTGDAAAIANLLNMIQSSWDPTNGDISTFTADLYQNYFGDLLFDPSAITNTGTSSNNQINNNGSSNLTINVEENASIINDIDLNATSGNATANGNTTVGDVSTGDATAIANVINMINSMITSGQSFLGSVNLYGDLDGDILLPESLLAQLMNTGTNSTNTITDSRDTNIDADINTSSSITNNTNLTATSGNAQADGNTNVGNVSTGDAETNVNQMNLIGQNVTGSKGLIVFVNVLGTWFGMLFGAPGNATILGTGTDSTNSIANNNSTNADLNVNRNFEIVNNLNLNATSGDATANGNTTVGNVSTGNASTSANILNMIDSSMNFTDWFGVLFINVFGTWNGSFGVNTSAGNGPTGGGMGAGEPSPSASAGEGHQVAGSSTNNTVAPKVFNFVPRGTSSGGTRVATTIANFAQADGGENAASTSSAQSAEESGGPTTQEIVADATSRGSFWLPVSFGVVAIFLLFGERIVALIRRPS